MVNSDYYHENNGEYRETRKPADELNGNLFYEWKADQWNEFYNIMAQCLHFYLSVPAGHICKPPMGNVTKRNLIAEMSDAFKAWADIYFGENRLNIWLNKGEAMRDFIQETNIKVQAHNFKKKMKAYCKYMNYEFNPEFAGTANRKVIVDGKETSAEHFYFANTKATVQGDIFTVPNHNPDAPLQF